MYSCVLWVPVEKSQNRIISHSGVDLNTKICMDIVHMLYYYPMAGQPFNLPGFSSLKKLKMSLRPHYYDLL